MTSSVVVCTWGEGRDGVPSESEEVLTLGRKVSDVLADGVELAGAGTAAGPGAWRSREATGWRTSTGPMTPSWPTSSRIPGSRRWRSTARSTRRRRCSSARASTRRLIAPRLAGRLGTGVVMNGVDVDVAEDGRLQITASAYGGDTRVVYELAGVESCVVSVLANAVLPEPLARRGSGAGAAGHPGGSERCRGADSDHRGRPDGGPPPRGRRDHRLGWPRSLGAPADYQLVEQLAKALGGMAGASRPLVDDGWVDSSRQVGLTGKITRPALYVAAGISGASQHMAGCSAAKTIVAINRDPDAAIFRYARYGIVGDCLEILPELIRAAKAR